MAGSYLHCVGTDGKFSFDLIENMGDAHEACEMMFYMIQDLAERVIGDKQKTITDAQIEYYNNLKERS